MQPTGAGTPSLPTVNVTPGERLVVFISDVWLMRTSIMTP